MPHIVAWVETEDEEHDLRARLAELGVPSVVMRLDTDHRQRVDVAEFRNLGLLQELNRRTLHPIGLALEVIQFEDGSEVLGGIWDARDDAEGFVYAEEVALDLDAAFAYDAMIDERAEARVALMGAVVQPIPGSFDAEELEREGQR